MSKRKPVTMTPVQAIEYLDGVGSHGNISLDGIAVLAASFGIALRANKHIANTDDPKGLTVQGMRPNSPVLSLGGWEAAEQIAGKLGLQWDRSKLGRGFRFREAMGAIRAHVSGAGA